MTPVTRRGGSEVHFSWFSLRVLILSLLKFFVSPLCAPTNQPPTKTDSALPESQLYKTPRLMSPYSCTSWISLALKFVPSYLWAHWKLQCRLCRWICDNGYVDGLWQRLCRWFLTTAMSMGCDNGWVNVLWLWALWSWLSWWVGKLSWWPGDAQILTCLRISRYLRNSRCSNFYFADTLKDNRIPMHKDFWYYWIELLWNSRMYSFDHFKRK